MGGDKIPAIRERKISKRLLIEENKQLGLGSLASPFFFVQGCRFETVPFSSVVTGQMCART